MRRRIGLLRPGHICAVQETISWDTDLEAALRLNLRVNLRLGFRLSSRCQALVPLYCDTMFHNDTRLRWEATASTQANSGGNRMWVRCH